MRRSYIYGLLVWVIMASACKDNHATQTPVASYFNTGDTGVRVAGIKMIPVRTPAGVFKVWTKRFGNISIAPMAATWPCGMTSRCLWRG